MSWKNVAWVLAVVPVLGLPTVKGQGQEKALAEVKRLGGKADLDMTAPGKPVVSVDLTNTKATDADLAFLDSLDSLTALRLVGTSVTDAGLQHIKGKKLAQLYLGTTKIGDPGLRYIKATTTLGLLDLSYTAVTGAGLSQLKGLTELTALDLRNTHVSDAGLVSLQGLKKLRNLHLSGTPITSAGLAQLKGMTGLEILELNQTAIGSGGLAHLSAFPNLRELDLNDTRITDAGLVQLKRLRKAGGPFLAEYAHFRHRFDGTAGLDQLAPAGHYRHSCQRGGEKAAGDRLTAAKNHPDQENQFLKSSKPRPATRLARTRPARGYWQRTAPRRAISQSASGSRDGERRCLPTGGDRWHSSAFRHPADPGARSGCRDPGWFAAALCRAFGTGAGEHPGACLHRLVPDSRFRIRSPHRSAQPDDAGGGRKAHAAPVRGACRFQSGSQPRAGVAEPALARKARLGGRLLCGGSGPHRALAVEEGIRAGQRALRLYPQCEAGGVCRGAKSGTQDGRRSDDRAGGGGICGGPGAAEKMARLATEHRGRRGPAA